MTVHLHIRQRGSHARKTKPEKGPHKHKRGDPVTVLANCLVCHGAFPPNENLGLLLRVQMHYIRKLSHHARLDPRIVAALRSEPGV